MKDFKNFKTALLSIMANVEKVKPKTWKRIRGHYMTHEDFTEEKMRGASSAAVTLYKWIMAADMFEKVKKRVKPLETALAEAKAKL